MDAELKKSYKGFVLWLLGFVVGNIILAPVIMKAMPEELAVYASLSVTLLFLILLMYVIYKTEYIYWINGVSYEMARKATGEQRKAYAAGHLKRFVRAGVVWLLYGAVKYAFGITLWWDVAVFMAVVIISAVSTVSIKL